MDYEDELERMKARSKSRKANHSANDDDFEETFFDDDFDQDFSDDSMDNDEYSWQERFEDTDTERHRHRSSPAERREGNYSSGSRTGTRSHNATSHTRSHDNRQSRHLYGRSQEDEHFHGQHRQGDRYHSGEYDGEEEFDYVANQRRGTANGGSDMRHTQNGRKNGNRYSVDSGYNPKGRRDQKASGTEKKRKKKKKKRFLLIIELMILATLLFFAFRFLGNKDQDGYWTVAVFGVDSRDGKLGKGNHSDVEIICNINRETGEIKLVSVFRDTYLKIDQKGTYHKINQAFFNGGPEQAVDALNENLDLNIDDYAVFNWKAVADTINILGGVDLEVTDAEFKVINGFITETVESTGIASFHLKGPGMQHLDGVQAVAYARLRKMDTDYHRTERQRLVLQLLMDKAKQADFSVLNNILVTVLPQVKTSVGVNDLIPIARGISKYHMGDSAGFPFARGTADIGKLDCVIPQTLESNVVQLHQFLFPEVSYSPSGTVKKISAKIASDSGMTEEGKNAPTGGGGGNSGNSSEKVIPQETAPPETTPEETTVTEETTAEVETAEQTSEETTEKPTKENGELVGPGANKPDKPSKPAESESVTSLPSEGSAVESSEGPSSDKKPTPEAAEPSSKPAGPGEAGPGVS